VGVEGEGRGAESVLAEGGEEGCGCWALPSLGGVSKELRETRLVPKSSVLTKATILVPVTCATLELAEPDILHWLAPNN